jgi:uncharacterized protein
MDAIASTQTIINNFLQRLNNHDAEGVGALFAEDIDWYVPGNTALPWVGSRSHRADVAAYFRTMWPHFEDGKSIVTPGSLVIAGNDVVIFVNFQQTVVSTGRIFRLRSHCATFNSFCLVI